MTMRITPLLLAFTALTLACTDKGDDNSDDSGVNTDSGGLGSGGDTDD